MIVFSIITPTYNRAHTLSRVYESLINQDFKAFEWIIMDDGSIDETESFVNSWISNNSGFHIRYYKLDNNKGKSYAVNMGIDYCKGEFTIIADSDDSFSSTTLSDLKSIWDENKLQSIGAIWTLVLDEDNRIVGDNFPEDRWLVDFKTRVLENHIKGEKWHCWRTSVLQSNKMFWSDESHIPEGITWNSINRKFDFLCVNIPHRVYYFSEDGLIAKKKSKIKAAKAYYHGAIYELENASIKNILKYKHYHFYAFEFIKSSFLLKRKTSRLANSKKTVCFVLFLLLLPKRIINKLA